VKSGDGTSFCSEYLKLGDKMRNSENHTPIDFQPNSIRLQAVEILGTEISTFTPESVVTTLTTSLAAFKGFHNATGIGSTLAGGDNIILRLTQNASPL
jgi:hypothetical protein